MKEIVIDTELLKTLTPNEFYMYSALRKAIAESADGKVDCYEVDAPRLTEKQRIKAIQSLEIKGLIRRRQCELNSPKIDMTSAPVKEEFATAQPQTEIKREIPAISEEDEAARLHKEAEEWRKQRDEKQAKIDRERIERMENEKERVRKRKEIIETIHKMEGGDINQIVRDVDSHLDGTEKDNEFLDYMIEKIKEIYPEAQPQTQTNSNNNDDEDLIRQITSFDYSD